jgi:SAM-dependent methyltransferase
VRRGTQRKIEQEIRLFYTRYPFPGWPDKPDMDDLARYRFRILAKSISKDEYRERMVLDAGCGTGNYSIWFARRSNKVIAIDLSLTSLRMARAMASEFGVLKNLELLQQSTSTLGFRDEAFDIVLSFGVLHCTPNPKIAFKELCRVTRNNGLIAVGVYNRYGRFRHSLRRWMLDLLAGDHPEKRLSWTKRLFPARVKAQSVLGTDNVDARVLDQFAVPHESLHTIGEVLTWFSDCGIEYVSSYPPVTLRESISLLRDDDIEPIVCSSIQRSSPVVFQLLRFLRKLLGRRSFMPLENARMPGLLDRIFIQSSWLVAGGDQFSYFTLLGRKKYVHESDQEGN